MKNFAKKICAVITLVAMIASLGVCGFAIDAGATVAITGYEWSDITNDGVIIATVYYTVDGTIGDLGATMLTYADAEDSTSIDEETEYADTMQIVGINQGAPVEGEEDGTYIVQFPVVLSSTGTSANGVQLGSGEGAVILIGGDNVTTPAAYLLTAPTLWDVASVGLTVEAGWDVPVTVYSDDTEELADAIEDAVLDMLTAEEDARTITAKDETELYVADLTFAGTDVLAAEATVESVNAEPDAYVATVEVTVPAGMIDEYLVDDTQSTGGVVPDGGLTFEIDVEGAITYEVPVWEVEEEPTIEAIDIELSEEDYAKTGAELNAAIKAVLETELVDDELVLNVKKADEESTATVTITADMIAVTEATAGEPMTYTATVTIAEGEYAVEGAEDMLVLDDDIVIAVTGNVTEELGVLYGDVNEDTFVDVNDAILIWQNELGIASLTDRQQVAANVNGDDSVDTNDAILIWQYELGIIDGFPVEE